MAVVSKTVVFKTFNDLELELDIHYTAGAQNAPVLVYFHGNGSPVQGARWDIPQHMINCISRWGYVLISADYRLAPQVGIQEIFDDVEDCIKFIRDPSGLSSSLPAGTINVQSLAVAGSGGGGYLALLAGLHVNPKPRAVLAFDPITNPLGSFFTTEHPWNQVYHGHWEKSTVEGFLERFFPTNGWVKANYTDNNSDEQYPVRGFMYSYMLHHGKLAEMLRLELKKFPCLDSDNFKWRVPNELGKNEQELPPTYIMHGSLDDQVGIEQSDEAVSALEAAVGRQRFRAYHRYERREGLGHGSGDQSSDQYMARMYTFLGYWL